MKKKSIFWAALIIILIGLWVGSGYLGGETENKDIPDNSLVIGSPGKIIREVLSLIHI